jgi:hypothetical protein
VSVWEGGQPRPRAIERLLVVCSRPVLKSRVRMLKHAIIQDEVRHWCRVGLPKQGTQTEADQGLLLCPLLAMRVDPQSKKRLCDCA